MAVKGQTDMRNSVFLLAGCALALTAAAHEGSTAPDAARYACGGIGQLEQQQFKHAAGGHDAMLTFATPSGSYLSDVDVKITTEGGDVVLQAFCDGPLMLLDIPAPGRYRISAMFDGQELQRTVVLGRNTARVLFTWRHS
jgi:hypothetical protein